MKTAEKKLYEGMFLVDANEAASDWDGVIGAVRNVLERSEAEIVSLNKWDDRRLAYEIDKRERGCYILCYFKVEGPKMAEIDRDIKLNDHIIRALILSAEPIPQEVVDADTPIMREQKAREQAEAQRAEQAQQEAEAKAVKEAEQATEAEQAQAPEETEPEQEAAEQDSDEESADESTKQ